MRRLPPCRSAYVCSATCSCFHSASVRGQEKRSVGFLTMDSPSARTSWSLALALVGVLAPSIQVTESLFKHSLICTKSRLIPPKAACPDSAFTENYGGQYFKPVSTSTYTYSSGSSWCGSLGTHATVKTDTQKQGLMDLAGSAGSYTVWLGLQHDSSCPDINTHPSALFQGRWDDTGAVSVQELHNMSKLYTKVTNCNSASQRPWDTRRSTSRRPSASCKARKT